LGVHANYRGDLPAGVRQAVFKIDDEIWGANDEEQLTDAEKRRLLQQSEIGRAADLYDPARYDGPGAFRWDEAAITHFDRVVSHRLSGFLSRVTRLAIYAEHAAVDLDGVGVATRARWRLHSTVRSSTAAQPHRTTASGREVTCKH
jgi:hypothetical protein